MWLSELVIVKVPVFVSLERHQVPDTQKTPPVQFGLHPFVPLLAMRSKRYPLCQFFLGFRDLPDTYPDPGILCYCFVKRHGIF